jgi:uncharacterized protein YndB with AHSA1/START domain
MNVELSSIRMSKPTFSIFRDGTLNETRHFWVFTQELMITGWWVEDRKARAGIFSVSVRMIGAERMLVGGVSGGGPHC